MTAASAGAGLLQSLSAGETTIWINEASGPPSQSIGLNSLADAHARFARFAPALRRLFPAEGWDGTIRSPLRPYVSLATSLSPAWVKADHELPLTGTIKARGGVHEVLAYVENVALREGLVRLGDDYSVLADPDAKRRLSKYTVGVGSTGNLGLSVGMTARAFGMQAEVHMSASAKAWKRDRLRELGVNVVEHEGDYARAVEAARGCFKERVDSHFIDDEHSASLFVGYAIAAFELADQLKLAGAEVSAEKPLIVYLPCGVGGAPGGITYGLKAIFGGNVRCVFAEPTAAASMLVALAFPAASPPSVYSLGLTNETIADGLATPMASPLVLDLVGSAIDAVVALPDSALVEWVGRAWREQGLRLEPSAAAGFAAFEAMSKRSGQASRASDEWARATHVIWTTGGAMLSDADFSSLLAASGRKLHDGRGSTVA